MVEFIEDGHIYLVDGVIVPSVTQIVRGAAGEDYSRVPPAVLYKKAEYGNAIHEWVEAYCMRKEELPQTEEMEQSTAQFKELFKTWGIVIHDCEQFVSFGTLYAGKYDLFGYEGNEAVLIDIKTTARYNRQYLESQMGLYNEAFANTCGIEIKKDYCLWMPKKKKIQLKPVQALGYDDCMRMVKEYEERNTDRQGDVFLDW